MKSRLHYARDFFGTVGTEDSRRKIRMRRRWKRKGRQRGTQSTTTETIRGAGWQQQMPRCRQDGELAPGTPVAGPAWDITRQMRSRADQRNAPHWERLNGCWCAPATTALWLQIISLRRRRRLRIARARARGSARLGRALTRTWCIPILRSVAPVAGSGYGTLSPTSRHNIITLAIGHERMIPALFQRRATCYETSQCISPRRRISKARVSREFLHILAIPHLRDEA